MIRGIDTYHGTGPKDWKKVAGSDPQIAFAVLKISEGTAEMDALFAHDCKAAAAEGLKVAAYHFFHVDADGEAQAKHVAACAQKAGWALAGYRVACDLEENPAKPNVEAYIGKSGIRQRFDAFSKVIQSETGRLPIIYGAHWWLQTYLGDGYAGHDLWIADPAHRPPCVPCDWKTYAIHQYSWKGVVPGIAGNVVDMNNFNGDAAHLAAFFGPVAAKKP